MPEHDSANEVAWYEGITRYQWTVLIIASLGWVFDVFEGQVFVASMREAIPSLVPPGTPEKTIQSYNFLANGAFLLGGAFGGVFFGVLSDRIGRKRTMAITILVYSVFTSLTAFSQAWWHLVIGRFLVAMGVGGEWAVASTYVAEVFPRRARAQVGGLFHASSVLGTYLAVAAGVFIVGNPGLRAWGEEQGIPSLPWRFAFLMGVLPALLIVWIRRNLKEPEAWTAAREAAVASSDAEMGRLADLFRGRLLRCTIVGAGLATIGLVTFWGTHIFGKDVLLETVRRNERIASNVDLTPDMQSHLKNWEMLGMLLVTTGGGIGLVSFGPLCQRLGRRGTFALFHAGAVVCAALLFGVVYGTSTTWLVIVALPVFGFWTLGMHAGYAIYLPELYPTRLRGSGAAFCFNGARVFAALVLFSTGALQQRLDLSLQQSAGWLSVFYLAAFALLVIAPETKDQELPE